MSALIVTLAIGSIVFGLVVLVVFAGSLAARSDLYYESGRVIDASIEEFEEKLSPKEAGLFGYLRQSGATRPIRVPKDPRGGPYDWAQARHRLLSSEYGSDFTASSINDVPVSFLVESAEHRDRLLEVLSFIRDNEDSASRRLD